MTTHRSLLSAVIASLLTVSHAAGAPLCKPELTIKDVTRPVTRYGRSDTSFSFESKREGIPTDLELHDRLQRPFSLVPWGSPIRELTA